MSLLLAVLTASGTIAGEAEQETPRQVEGFPAAAEQALKAVTLAEDIEASLFAAEPLLANPVALSVDERGRVFVCETYRVGRGVEDNRNHLDWVDDDLAAQTVDDRLAFFKKHTDEDLSSFTSYEDRIRLLVDRNGDGQADFSRVFADGFKGALEGIGADVLARNDQVYYTCIPNLWQMSDTDGDGRADQRTALHYGFGVRVAFLGHDLHGLCVGQDGRLYFSIGDRGYHVKTKDKIVADPESGAVFRCELDGSGLEVFATGLRNPQDLAFDEDGFLFTGDNNSDSGDRARWVHLMEGADIGWRMAYQYLGDRGPWNRDRLWEPLHPAQPAYITPPVANFGDGPSGLAYYPGTGLPRRYQGNFFLCDFRGQASQSGIRTFKVRPRGATFELIDEEVFAWNCLPTDCKFGPEGALYTADWIEGWDGTGKGRVHRFFHPASIESKAAQEVQDFLAADASQLKAEQLTRLMAHPDMRLRNLGQFELARRGLIKPLLEVAQQSEIQLARMHAMWGLGQIARNGQRLGNEKLVPSAIAAITPFAQDVDAKVRVVAITMLGDQRVSSVTQTLIDALGDDNHQVRYAAAIALGKLQRSLALGPLVRMLKENAGTDAGLRHAGVMGLAGCGNADQLARLQAHADAHVRQAAVVALRRQAAPRVADFLTDSSDAVKGEAVRAIYDVPIEQAFPAVASIIDAPFQDHEAMRRVLCTHFRLGTPENAAALVQFALDNDQETRLRAFAVKLLKLWKQPPSRDPILGMWRPLSGPRDPRTVVETVTPLLTQLLESAQPVRMQVAQLAADYKITEAEDFLSARVLNTQADAEEREGLLLALGALAPEGLRDLVEQMLEDEEPRVRAAARVVFSQLDPDAAVPVLVRGFRNGTPREKQSAVEMLARLQRKRSDQALEVLMQAYLDNQVPDVLRLDVMEAAAKRSLANPRLQELVESATAQWKPGDRLAPFRDALHGGDPGQGERLFFEEVQLECTRCHQVGDRGGKVGPALDNVGAQSRTYLLESIVHPDKAIAKGFESVILETDDGKTVSGIVQEKTDTQVRLMQSDGVLITVDVDTIEAERRGQSAMPENLVDKLSLFQLRDLIAYLAQLQPETEAAP